MTSSVRIAGFAALVFVVAACGGSSGDGSADTTAKSALTTAKVIGGAPSTAPAGVTTAAAKALEGTAILTASDNTFGPAKAKVKDKVQLVSGDPVGHTVVSETNAWTYDDKSSS